jgi:hypothetical protein
MNLRLERRLAPRRKTNIDAKIAFLDGPPICGCVIRNISETGAKLEVGPVGAVPDRFQLLVPGHRPQPCQVVWRALKEIGIEYA